MDIADILRIKTTVSMAELKRNPKKIIGNADDLPMAILNSNKPKAYLLSAKAYEVILDFIDDASLIKTIKARRGGKTIKVKI
ncbi:MULTISPECIES: type II toxin-antitoxin system Phd/YefM family antitoxin [unclassified Polynucleobacter]|uniref:type II toxin-antitoxin system Phd/YefM family antitoxin n=1 Tax=unclassified Polynucleobacter TaxID=2640945 RepID=UPI001BFD0F86|nr:MULTISPECIES: type II toxin-antitoxin system Phd/YefM family antitoxin [unclassified Polynucleobacter]MBU3547803.1 type II toxin-antitoxin system Phd/YefM family antitoxin [Polynucleobacter sp. P1-05-14]QWD81879.1 type II toxin-antitoxin system Phd/YefM family antitoxin [Polynucleobacter sp. MWH-S4W17]